MLSPDAEEVVQEFDENKVRKKIISKYHVNEMRRPRRKI